jgi:hypothetical protein
MTASDLPNRSLEDGNGQLRERPTHLAARICCTEDYSNIRINRESK